MRIKALRPDIVSLGQGPMKDVGPVKVAIVRMTIKVDLIFRLTLSLNEHASVGLE